MSMGMGQSSGGGGAGGMLGNFAGPVGGMIGNGLMGGGLLGSTLGGLGGAGLGASLGSFAGPIGMAAGALLGSMLLSKKNAPPIQDIAAATVQGNPISDAAWAKAGLPSGGGPQWQQSLAQAKALGPLDKGALFGGRSNTPLQDVQEAILTGKSVSPQSWAMAGFQNGPPPIGAQGAPGQQTGTPQMPPLNIAQLPQGYQGGMMRNPGWLAVANQRFPGLLGPAPAQFHRPI